jgi:hypothetical protein
MFFRQIFGCAVVGFGLAIASPASGLAQVQVMSASPPNVEYQYQLYYPRVWGWPGPGLSLGGSLPSKGREGISSFYGRPLPVPLGAGVYVNPFAYSAQLPGPPLAFGLASNSPNPTTSPALMNPPASQTADTTPMLPAGQTTPSGTTNPSTTTTVEPVQRSIPVSSPAAIQQSLSMEAMGNVHFQRQNWLQAYINYRNAVMTARDRAEPHVRLAFAAIALKRYPEAAQEFKQAITIDSTSVKTGESLETIFGIEDSAVRKEIVRDVAIWSQTNLRDQDRLFLLGLILQYNNDGRSNEILQAAMQVPGPKEHLQALLTPAVPVNDPVMQASISNATEPSKPSRLPELHEQPLALH